MDDAGWLKALKLEGYAPRRSSGPMALQQVLFPYLDATQGVRGSGGNLAVLAGDTGDGI